MRCETCVFYDAYLEAAGKAGDCRRYPPPHPNVVARDWCGEWQRKTIANVESQDDH